MSVSDNSTLPVAHDDEAPYQLLDNLAHEGDPRVDSNVKSPYTDTEIISLDVGPKQTRYRVHRAILAQSSELDAKPALKLWGEKTNDTISLPELDDMTAHALVHYLYTARYHTLDLERPCAISEYRLSTCVYCAAIRYKLPGLAELAKKTMLSLQEDLTILDVLLVAREHAFPLLPEDEAWFSAYLEDAIHAAVTKDAGLFTRPGFVDQIEGDRRYRQVVMKAIVSSYSRGGSAADVSSSEDKEQQTPALSETLLDEINPTVDTHVAPEPYMDELGWESSKTFQKMGGHGLAAVAAAPVPVPAKPGHTRNDSVVEVEQVAPLLVASVETGGAASPEAVVVNGADGTATASKKSKKKNKKKASGTVVTN